MVVEVPCSSHIPIMTMALDHAALVKSLLACLGMVVCTAHIAGSVCKRAHLFCDNVAWAIGVLRGRGSVWARVLGVARGFA
jgi:hypothetical protein